MTSIYTIGYGGRKPEELLQRLKEKEIRAVADVRLRPDRSSMGIYAKSKDPAKGIEGLLAKEGIQYVSLVELGNVFLDSEDWMDRYTRLLLLAGDLLTLRLRDIPTPYCLLCAEKSAVQCHRKLIADYLAKQGHSIEHLE
jgi:uncharacterized protein (DUF488 family)